MATIEKATLTLSVETITWQECKRLVDECNGNNRNISVRHVNRLSRDARAGRWPLTHQGIALDHNGHVIDGQHRLAAHAMAQRDLTTVVCRYKSALAAQEAMIIIDSGRARGTADALAVSGVVKKEIARDAVAVCEKTPSKIYVTDETAKWAKAALGGGPVKTKAESAPVQAEDTMQTKVLKVLSRGGAWAIPDIVQEVKGKHGYVAGTLMQLTQLRRIKRVGRGVYALSEVAA